MAAIAQLTPKQANLNYLKRDPIYLKEKPFQAFVNVPEGEKSTNLVFETVECNITDVRGRKDDFSLRDNGFVYFQHNSKLDGTGFESEQMIDEIYLPECEEIIKSHMAGADHTFIFDWRIRRNVQGKKLGETINLNDRMQHLLPSVQVHIDTSAISAANRVQYQLGEYAEPLMKGRIQVINVWRPINNPVADCALAVCDGSTIAPEDLLVCDHVTAKYAAETTYPHWKPTQRWYYLKDQRPDEVLLFKNFDSHPDGKASVCPHSSFEAFPKADADSPRPFRESIEVRFLVFTFGDDVNEGTRAKIRQHASKSSTHDKGFGV